jgi:hypothetical protein
MQDPYSGYSYPGYAETEQLGEPVYDGFGNPLGFLPFLSNLIPGVPKIPGITSIPGLPSIPGFPGAAQPPHPSFRPPWPLGWQRPQVPYTGLGPRRLYMRCAVWPGPRGLVPAFAQTAPGAAIQQAAAMQQAAQMAAQRAGGMRRHRRRRRR